MSRTFYYDPKYLPKIQIIAEQQEIGNVKQYRRIAILLPHNYDKSTKHYPVLYLQDGQNLCNENSPFGNWAVDKRMAALAERGLGDIIIVAIDHAEENRIKEFNPFQHPKIGRGQGRKYVKFVTDQLKPYVDKHFRTKPEREHTGIGGSSLGGLISLFAGMVRPKIFSKLLVFSPSLWISPKIYLEAQHYLPRKDTRIYLYGGEKESVNMVSDLERLRVFLGRKKTVTLQLSVNEEGEHNEYFWGQEFEEAFLWLFKTENKKKKVKTVERSKL